MIKSVTVTNYLNESIKLELGRPEKSGLLIYNIDGLGPPKANIKSTEMTSTDGSIVNSERVTARNIVMKLVFLWKPTIEAMRQLSYKYFPIKRKLKLLIETDNRYAETYGYVETNDPIIFGSTGSTSISIICPDPYFYSSGSRGFTTTMFSGIEESFEFPFSNESLTENLIGMGEIQNKTENSIYYLGDAETGMYITIHAIGEVTDITLYNRATRETMFIDTTKLATLTGSGIISGDTIEISTVKGAKGIYLLRNGEYTNIINCLGKDSSWFHLTKGDNLIAYTAVTGATYLNFKIKNRTLFEGL